MPDQSAKLTNEILEIMDSKVRLQTAQELQSLQTYRLTQQLPHTRREYDLNDPEALKKSLPARTEDNDPRIGVSSLQRFEGEDLAKDKRSGLQKEQVRVWTDTQVFEREMRKVREREEEKGYEAFQRGVAEKMEALQAAVDSARRERAKLDNEYNAALVNLFI